MSCTSPTSWTVISCVTVNDSIFITLSHGSLPSSRRKFCARNGFCTVAFVAPTFPPAFWSRVYSGEIFRPRKPAVFELASRAGMVTSLTSALKNCRSLFALPFRSAATIEPSLRE